MAAKRRNMIEQHCQQRLSDVLQQIDLAGVVNMTQLCQALSIWRNRPIHLLPLATPPGLTGMWLEEPTEDVIIYASNAPQTLAEQAIGHELGHLLSGHKAHEHALPARAKI